MKLERKCFLIFQYFILALWCEGLINVIHCFYFFTLKEVTPPFKDDRSFSRHIECPVHSFLKIQVLDATAKSSPVFL